jgi:hypothetical protein
MNDWTNEQLVATRNLYETLFKLKLVTALGVFMVCNNIDDILRQPHRIFL